MQSRQTEIDAKEVILATCSPLNNQFEWTLKSTMREKMIEAFVKIPDVVSI